MCPYVARTAFILCAYAYGTRNFTWTTKINIILVRFAGFHPRMKTGRQSFISLHTGSLLRDRDVIFFNLCFYASCFLFSALCLETRNGDEIGRKRDHFAIANADLESRSSPRIDWTALKMRSEEEKDGGGVSFLLTRTVGIHDFQGCKKKGCCLQSCFPPLRTEDG